VLSGPIHFKHLSYSIFLKAWYDLLYKIQIQYPVKALYDLTKVTAFIVFSLRQYLPSYAEIQDGYTITKKQDFTVAQVIYGMDGMSISF
jgi:hypothetical protein